MGSHGVMTDMQNIKRRVVHTEQHIINPIGRRLPITMLETTGGSPDCPDAPPWAGV